MKQLFPRWKTGAVKLHILIYKITDEKFHSKQRDCLRWLKRKNHELGKSKDSKSSFSRHVLINRKRL